MSLPVAFSKLFLLVLISLSCTAITHTAPLGPDRNFVEKSCSHTPHPKKCNYFLSKRNGEFQNKPQLLAIASISISMDEIVIAKRNLKIIKDRKETHNFSSINSCITKLNFCYDRLGIAYQALRNLSVTSKDFTLGKNKIDVSIKGALAYISSCIKDFAPPAMNGKVKDSVMSNVTNVEDLVRNNMALMNLVTAVKNRKFL